ncbi:MAG TPA: DNA methyltransferase [Chitinophagaceae bacterium]|jgi:tRNA G10  N-methylase Trm11|nr:DNA methyltransferase [Chitinophagaceae bacterium]
MEIFVKKDEAVMKKRIKKKSVQKKDIRQEFKSVTKTLKKKKRNSNYLSSKNVSSTLNLNKSGVKYQIKFKSPANKIVDESWDFRKSNTKEYTHCFHAYPAMMIPQVARRIIENYGQKSKLLFDPYCGTGTSLVEANLKGMNAIGTDINPLAQLIASAKTTKIDIQILDLFLHDFANYFFSINFQSENIKSVIIPEIKNIDFWFSNSVQKKLGILLKYIENIQDSLVKNFFKVAFSETVRETSFVKPGEFKLVRRKDFNGISDHDVFGIMVRKLSRNKQGLVEFTKTIKNGCQSSVYGFNTVSSIPCNVIASNSIDIVVTSPPYGDSRTTVAYGQYSRLANEWLGYQKANQVDNILMGGKKRKHLNRFKSDVLNDVVSAIEKKDKERVRDVVSFYEDYEKSITHVSTTMKKGSFACYVVGNRTVKGVNIPTDEITAQLFEQNKFSHIETIVRNIPNKRMPSKNSPSNIVGETASTMKNEYIVICQKN